MMARTSVAFRARFRALIRKHGNNTTMALRLGVSPSHISQVVRGVSNPSRDFVERLITEHGLDRDEWLRLAGYAEEDAEDERLRGVIQATINEVFRQNLLAARARAEQAEAALARLQAAILSAADQAGVVYPAGDARAALAGMGEKSNGNHHSG